MREKRREVWRRCGAGVVQVCVYVVCRRSSMKCSVGKRKVDGLLRAKPGERSDRVRARLRESKRVPENSSLVD